MNGIKKTGTGEDELIFKVGANADKHFQARRVQPAPLDIEQIGAHEVDGAGNPIGSTSELNHQIAERERMLRALGRRAKLNAADMQLARELGINVGPDPKDPNQFDL